MTNYYFYEVFNWLGVLGFFGVWVWLLGEWCLTFTSMTKLLKSFEGCSAVNSHWTFLDSVRDRMELITTMTNILARPRIYLRNGSVSAKAIDNFPRGLKKILIALYWVRVVSLWLLIVAVFFLHLDVYFPSSDQPVCY